MGTARLTSPFDTMRRALVVALLYVDDLHAFGWSAGDEARFDREFNRIVGVAPRQFMHLAGQVSARPEARCSCGLCERPRSTNIWLGAQAAQIAFGPPVKPADLEPLKTHHRSCALRKGGTSCSC